MLDFGSSLGTSFECDILTMVGEILWQGGRISISCAYCHLCKGPWFTAKRDRHSKPGYNKKAPWALQTVGTPRHAIITVILIFLKKGAPKFWFHYGDQSSWRDLVLTELFCGRPDHLCRYAAMGYLQMGLSLVSQSVRHKFLQVGKNVRLWHHRDT